MVFAAMTDTICDNVNSRSQYVGLWVAVLHQKGQINQNLPLAVTPAPAAVSRRLPRSLTLLFVHFPRLLEGGLMAMPGRKKTIHPYQIHTTVLPFLH